MHHKIPKNVPKRLNPKRRKKEKQKARVNLIEQLYENSLKSGAQQPRGQEANPYSRDRIIRPFDEFSNTENTGQGGSNIGTGRHQVVNDTAQVMDQETSGEITEQPTSPKARHEAATIVRILVDHNSKMDVEDLYELLNMEPFYFGFEDVETLINFLKSFSSVFVLHASETSTESLEVELRVNVEVCLPHTSGNCKGNCNGLHLCKFFVLNACEIWKCKFGHEYETPHNQKVLQYHLMQYLQPAQVSSLMKAFPNRKGVCIPGICRFYNTTIGCRSSENCPYLHVCKFVAEACRYYPFCRFSHNLLDLQPRVLLWKYGINMNHVKKEDILKLLLRSAYVDNQHAQYKKMMKEVTSDVVEQPTSGPTDPGAKPAETRKPFRWRPIEDVSGSWDTFSEEEDKVIHKNFMLYKKAYEKYMRFKTLATSIGNKK
jgi:hypothetical protein